MKVKIDMRGVPKAVKSFGAPFLMLSFAGFLPNFAKKLKIDGK